MKLKMIVCFCMSALFLQAAERPNIVLILADDMGYSDLGCYGGEISTPNLDRLAETGLRYTDFHNAARCCPTRASLLTGLYPHEAGVGDMVYEDLGEGYLGHLNDHCTTLGQALGAAGYRTMMSGKWHVGHQSESLHPEQRGFERFYGIYLHVDSYFKVLPDCDIYLNGVKQIPGDKNTIPAYPGHPEKEFYTTDVFTDYALNFLDEAYQDERPFFLYLAYNAPHWPLEAPERNIEKYRGKYDRGWDVLAQEKTERMKKMGILPANAVLPETENARWEELSGFDKQETIFRREIYAGQVDRMDENIGRVVDSLKKAGKLDNTLILFLSDNGCSAERGMLGYKFGENRKDNYEQWRKESVRSASQGQAWARLSNVPFRKYKKFTYEGGSRTPLIAHWPARIKDPGSFRRDPGHIIDIMATVCDLAGTTPPAGTRGFSLNPTFDQKPLTGRDALYWEHEGNKAIRMGNWKMVSTGKNGPWELYNLADDPTETKDLSAKYPERVSQMNAKWTEWAEGAHVLPDIFDRRAKKKRQQPFILKTDALQAYVQQFNADDEELYTNAVPNAQACDFLKRNIPLFECPDADFERTWYFRWWTYRKHLKKTPDGYVITEFLPNVPWSGKYNTISCPAALHFYEGRWIRNPQYLDDYAVFWFRKGGAPRLYSCWLADALYARTLVQPNEGLLTGLLDDLIVNYRQWEKEHRDNNGLFYQTDDRDGGEISIGGSGFRPPLNSYMYGDARAIAAIASLAGRDDVTDEFTEEANELRELVLTRLWDESSSFFKVLPPETPDQPVDVRELHGYTPWYFNLPVNGNGYETAWKQLMDPKGFYAPFGPTTAEQRHPGFVVSYEGHVCQWNGPSWPMATSITLTALANVLNNYDQNVISKNDWFETLGIYTRSQKLLRESGRTVPWIDENLNPFTGEWIARARLKTWENGAWPPGKGGRERGKDYNHSSYNDLIITGLVGLRPRADNIAEINPLLPADTWDYFCLDNVFYHGRMLTILWDKTGKKYGKGSGLKIFADGKCIGESETLSKLTGVLK